MVQERIDSGFSSRIRFIFIILFLTLISLGVRLYFLQIHNYAFYREKAESQQVVNVTIPARRGTFYDINRIPLASSEKAQTICLLPAQLDSNVDWISLLSTALNEHPDTIRRKVASSRECLYIKRKVSDRFADRIRKLNIPGIRFEEESRRNYPNGTLFAHIIGFTGVDNNGLEGLELRFNRNLAGRDGFQEINRNALNSMGAFVKTNGNFRAQEDGSDIHLTLDAFVQGIVEEELTRIQAEFDPDGSCAVAVDPRSGRILAMANMPTFSPMAYGRAKAEARRNRSITDIYEPGSVMKIFTAAAAIDSGLDPESQLFDCENGVFYYRHRTLHDHHPYGEMNLKDIIVHSSNIGVAKVGIHLGKEIVHKYFAAFGFGRSTKVDFPGEQSGYLRPLRSWDSFTITSVPMGHEITANSLQIVMAASAVVNGGLLYRPQMIDRIVDARGRILMQSEPEISARVISNDSSLAMRKILQAVVEDGTGKKARISGISVGGKTGTAQLLVEDPATGKKVYSESAYMASFVGFAPVEDPRICIIVSVRHPKGPVYYGGSVAAPAVRTIIKRTLDYITEPVMTVSEHRQ